MHRYLDLGASLDICKGPVDVIAADAVRELIAYHPGKPVILAETAYPFTSANADSEGNAIGGSTPCSGYPATWAGQASEFTAVQNTARSAGAVGVFYWEPTWYAIKGNGWDPANINGTGDQWDNMTLFDWTGHVNPSVSWKA